MTERISVIRFQAPFAQAGFVRPFGIISDERGGVSADRKAIPGGA
jgi:hypothetical protein